MPQYAGKTTLVFLPDHGRGNGPESWKDHGQKLPDSKYVFMAFMGPGITAVGVRHDAQPVFSNQVAAALARMLGLDWNAAEPLAGQPIKDVIQTR